jgi:hypothetical protein
VGIVGDPGTDPVFDDRIEPREVAGLRRGEVDQPHIEVRHGRSSEVGQDDGQPGQIPRTSPYGDRRQPSSRVQGPRAGEGEAAPSSQSVTINGHDLGNSGHSNARLGRPADADLIFDGLLLVAAAPGKQESSRSTRVTESQRFAIMSLVDILKVPDAIAAAGTPSPTW